MSTDGLFNSDGLVYRLLPLWPPSRRGGAKYVITRRSARDSLVFLTPKGLRQLRDEIDALLARREMATATIPDERLPEHLREDAPYVQCSACGRKSWGDVTGCRCAMPQPDGSVCEGWFGVPQEA